MANHWRIPGPEAGELEWLIFEQSGVLTHAQAVRHLSPGRVRGRVSSGRWRSLARGILLTSNGDLTRPQQLWAAVLAAGPGAVLAGATAATEGGVRGLRNDPIHVLIPAQRRRATTLPRLPPDMAGVAVHRTTLLPAAHLQRGRPTRTSLPRAVADAVAWARTSDEGRVVLASAFQQRRVTLAEVQAVLSELPRSKRRALAVETIGDLAGGSESLAEIDLVRLCRRYRLPLPERQQRRRDQSGRLRFLDAYWPRWALQVEVDGAHHLEVRHWEADMRRQNDVWVRGDRILRFSAYQIRHRPAEVAEQIARALAAAGWEATPR
ncbi:DUF559 domain-containing protein [Natronosporangium hydrolyticum]|uniref:DUF559 domain-containing protein n=1 Tax=Natronosporangium hydrolyticum TaxID=2811111 RepID=A0A895YDW5_9ACTN|nr:DUF559 domain-containing protein [Natronosporangium hydrolyticum]QSB15967.1 DUF559 domain-containing protein [Natronosporangium hydrolyticum]